MVALIPLVSGRHADSWVMRTECAVAAVLEAPQPPTRGAGEPTDAGPGETIQVLLVGVSALPRDGGLVASA